MAEPDESMAESARFAAAEVPLGWAACQPRLLLVPVSCRPSSASGALRSGGRAWRGPFWAQYAKGVGEVGGEWWALQDSNL